MTHDRETIRAVLNLFQPEGADFYHNEPNDYGCITLKLFSGKGDPWRLYAGAEIMGSFQRRDRLGTEARGSGLYRLNDAAVDLVAKLLGDRSDRRIIDRDIDSYQASLETELARLRRCDPALEHRFQRRATAAKAVVDAMLAYRAAIDLGGPDAHDKED